MIKFTKAEIADFKHEEAGRLEKIRGHLLAFNEAANALLDAKEKGADVWALQKRIQQSYFGLMNTHFIPRETL